MKTYLTKLLLIFLLIATNNTNVFACPAPGTYTIGPTGTYTSISAAITDLNSCASLTGAYIFEFQPAYNSSVEIFPVTIPAFAGSSSTNTITFRPQAGASGISVTSSNVIGTLLLDGASYISFDGRPGGTGTPKNLTVQNTNIGASYAIQLINDASNNNIKYCNVRSANTSTTSGSIVFSTAGAGTGNDNNAINNCDIFDAAVGFPANAIYQDGSASPNDNSNNNISTNNIYNFFNATNNTNGVYLLNNATDWTIAGNSFYETATRNFTIAGNTFAAIQTASGSINNVTITGNYIGGNAALAAGTPLTLTGTVILSAMWLNAGATVTNNVHSNTIKNISITSSSNSGGQSLINIAGGRFNVGTVATPNVLGTQSATGSVIASFSNSTAIPNNPVFAGISANSATADIVNITGNTIGGIDITGTSTTAYAVGIYFGGNTGTYIVDRNTIGSIATANSISSNINNFLIGIWGYMTVAGPAQTISNNTIVNLAAKSTSTGNPLYGILMQGSGMYDATANTVYNLSSASASALQSITGIYLSSNPTGGQSITQNKVYNLSNTSATGATGLAGIYFVGPTTGSNIIAGNFVHSCSLATTNNNGFMIGIYASAGTATYQNNMVSLGINAAGSSIAGGYYMYGIYDGATAVNNFYFNSVYIGGTGVVASTNATFPFYSKSTTGTRNFSNNIFFNARSSASSTGTAKHFGYFITGLTGLTSNYNDIIITGTDKMFAYYGANRTTLLAWKIATSKDLNSISSDPKFLNPAGASSTVDLHINSASLSLIDGNGLAIAAVTDDYDLQLRSSLSPTDIGADALNLAAETRVDPGITALAVPSTGSCYSNAEVVKITIKNFGTTPINFVATPVTVTVNVTGVVTQTLTGTISSTVLAVGSSTDVTMSTTLNMTTGGTYTFNATITAIGGSGVDADITNDFLSPAATRTASGFSTWLGINTNWNDPLNWCGIIPDGTIDITIPDYGLAGNYPIITTGINAAVKSISIANNAVVTTNSGATLTINGAIVNNGGIINNGGITLGGTVSTNFPGTGNINTINDLTINKTSGATVTINKAFTISGTFTPTLGNVVVNDVITLRSSKDSTARVGQSGAVFSYGGAGFFEAQRYIPARRAWRLITAPLSSSLSIYNTWQNSGNYGAGNYGKGTLITGPGASPGTNGLDVSPLNNYSLKTWDISSQNLVGVTNTLSQIISDNTNTTGAKNTGYFMFVRGDRNPVNTDPANVNTTTLSSKGYLQTGTQIFAAAPASGSASVHRLTLVGNPYASPIDFGQLTKTNLLDQFTVWDPNVLTYGRYVTVTRSGGSYIMTPDRGAGGPNQYIQSGQAFFVETDLSTSISPTLTLQETHKASNNSLTVFRPSAALPRGVRINLYRVENNNTTILADGAYALFDESYNTAVSLEDAIKFTNMNETFGLQRNGHVLAVEKRPLIVTQDTLFLKLTRATQRHYRIELEPAQMGSTNIAGFINDKFMQTSTAINLEEGNTDLDFSITADSLSNAADRFSIVFKPAVVFGTLAANTLYSDVAVGWKIASEYNINNYEVQRSIDGANFSTAFSIASKGNSKEEITYNWLDEKPAPGLYYYRIKSINKNGAEVFSEKVKVIVANRNMPMYVFPNPVTDNIIHLQMNDILGGIYSIRLLNSKGQSVFTKKIIHTVNTSNESIDTGKKLAVGLYQLEIKGADKKTTTISIVVQ